MEMRTKLLTAWILMTVGLNGAMAQPKKQLGPRSLRHATALRKSRAIPSPPLVRGLRKKGHVPAHPFKVRKLPTLAPSLAAKQSAAIAGLEAHRPSRPNSIHHKDAPSGNVFDPGSWGYGNIFDPGGWGVGRVFDPGGWGVHRAKIQQPGHFQGDVRKPWSVSGDADDRPTEEILDNVPTPPAGPVIPSDSAAHRLGRRAAEGL